jgi:DNA-binding NtrC family response regulator
MTCTGILIVSSEPVAANVVASALSGDESLHVVAVRSYRAALCALAKEPVTIIICDDVLPDGSWKDLLGQIAMLNDAPRLIVMTPPDRGALWAEAISLGAYDVLTKPLAGSEVRQVCSSARRAETRWIGEPVAD